MRITKAMIYHKYAKELKPIPKSTLETIRRKTAKMIWVKDRNGSCECEYCQTESTLPKTKHLETAKCPNCGRKMQVRHTWRKTWHDSIDWCVLAESHKENVIVYRYVLCFRVNGQINRLEERARAIWDFNTEKVYHLEKAFNEKEFPERERHISFFSDHSRFSSWQVNSFCCQWAEPLAQTWNAIKKAIPELKYCSFKGYRNGLYVPSVVAEYRKNYSLYEKLEKVGLADMIKSDMNRYWREEGIKYNKNERELSKMLGLTKDKYRHLLSLKDDYLNSLEWLQKVEEIDAKERAEKVNLSINDWQTVTKNIGATERDKNIRYCTKQKCVYHEYAHYLDTAQRAGFDIKDESYKFPKDFRKMDELVTAEYQRQKDEEELKKLSKQTRKIKKISDALRKMPDIGKFLQGSKGFLVYVPESAKDLKDEGRNLHNCIGTYVDRIADGKTLVFFIRRLDDKNAPFVAMEYSQGHIIQCRYDYNKAVEEDSEIYSFAKAFANVLKKNNVLTKVA